MSRFRRGPASSRRWWSIASSRSIASPIGRRLERRRTRLVLIAEALGEPADALPATALPSASVSGFGGFRTSPPSRSVQRMALVHDVHEPSAAWLPAPRTNRHNHSFLLLLHAQSFDIITSKVRCEGYEMPYPNRPLAQLGDEVQ